MFCRLKKTCFKPVIREVPRSDSKAVWNDEDQLIRLPCLYLLIESKKKYFYRKNTHSFWNINLNLLKIMWRVSILLLGTGASLKNENIVFDIKRMLQYSLLNKNDTWKNNESNHSTKRTYIKKTIRNIFFQSFLNR